MMTVVQADIAACKSTVLIRVCSAIQYTSEGCQIVCIKDKFRNYVVKIPNIYKKILYILLRFYTKTYVLVQNWQ